MDPAVVAARRIQVACSADQRYGPHCAAMLHSLLTKQARNSVVVHFMHGPRLPRMMRRRLGALVTRLHGEIRFHEISDATVARLPVLPRIPSSMWYRIFLPDLLPDAERVLYLDADTLIVTSLDVLWDMDLTGYYLAAVTNVMDPLHRAWPGELGIKRLSDYFNSGVLLMNLAALRQADCMRRLCAYGIEMGARLRFPDQDALNAVLGQRRRHLHPRWNCMNSLSFFADSETFFDPGLVADAIRDPGIVHFEGPTVVKPWHFLNRNPHRDLYYHHLCASGWPMGLPEGMTLRNIAKVYLPESAKKPLRKVARWLGPDGRPKP